MPAHRANLHGRPLAAAKQAMRLVKDGHNQFVSRRAWGRALAQLVHEMAMTNIEPENFTGHVTDWLVRAIRRERDLMRLAACGITPVAA